LVPRENIQQFTQFVSDIHSDLFRGYTASRQRELWQPNHGGDVGGAANGTTPRRVPEAGIEVDRLVPLGEEMEPCPREELEGMFFDTDMANLLSGRSFSGMNDFDLSSFLSGPGEPGLPTVIEQPLVAD